MDGSCSIKKPGKESARNCALGLLIKVMKRSKHRGDEEDSEIGFTPQEVETAIYNAFSARSEYLRKISKVALHLSLFTRTGRVSYTFQEAIFNKESTNGGTSIDGGPYLDWLVKYATVEEIFPELYQSGMEKIDFNNFSKQMDLEQDAILAGLSEIVSMCCDKKVCSHNEIQQAYDSELFKIGTIFDTAAKSICMTRKVDRWVPPSNEVYIPNTSPINSDREPKQTTKSIYPNKVGGYLENGSNLTIRPLTSRSIERNFEVTGQVICFDVSNLIHNLAVLDEGRLLVLPWSGEIISLDVQTELIDKFRLEIFMRRYYLNSRQ
jgi:hypothetical protein